MRFKSTQFSSDSSSATLRSKSRPRLSSPRSVPIAQPWVILGEDDSDMRELLCYVLEERGYRVTPVEDGQQLATAIHDAVGRHGDSRYPDLVISDVRMPKVSGLSVLKNLRRAGWEIPVIIMTAFPDRDMVREVRKLDAELVPKPFAFEDLINKVHNIIARRES